MRFWQLGESHYWGHNAILRMAPFMRPLRARAVPGDGPLAGEVMSHDFVEAALMRRAGWKVWVADELDGSYEQVPPNLLAELQRDRRWCHGNLQNSRLMFEPGLHAVHRTAFLTGVLAYASSPLWLAFLMLSTLLFAQHAGSDPIYFFEPEQLFPIWPTANIKLMLTLFGLTAVLLLAPKVMALIAIVVRGEARRFGGVARLLASAFIEFWHSLLLAPVRMLFHTQFVVAAMTGWRLDWRSPPRDDAATTWREAAARHGAPHRAGARLDRRDRRHERGVSVVAVADPRRPAGRDSAVGPEQPRPHRPLAARARPDADARREPRAARAAGSTTRPRAKSPVRWRRFARRSSIRRSTPTSSPRCRRALAPHGERAASESRLVEHALADGPAALAAEARLRLLSSAVGADDACVAKCSRIAPIPTGGATMRIAAAVATGAPPRRAAEPDARARWSVGRDRFDLARAFRVRCREPETAQGRRIGQAGGDPGTAETSRMADDIAALRRILRSSRTIAVVGLSAEWHRPSFFAAKYMQEHGYRIIPVNPRYDEILGERCHAEPDDDRRCRSTSSTSFAAPKTSCRSPSRRSRSRRSACGSRSASRTRPRPRSPRRPVSTS